jgi:hypothetical protein
MSVVTSGAASVGLWWENLLDLWLLGGLVKGQTLWTQIPSDQVSSALRYFWKEGVSQVDNAIWGGCVDGSTMLDQQCLGLEYVCRTV